MASILDLGAIFRQDAEALRAARETAMQIHSTDIRAAGNQVEAAVREYLRRMLEPRYHVTSGHLIDPESRVSPQIDIIIADNFGPPFIFDDSRWNRVHSGFAHKRRPAQIIDSLHK